jgi:GntR family transcriptional repressor for pyruvate dehydrogenase complex
MVEPIESPRQAVNVKSPNIAEDLFEELRRQILSGRLEPGTRLPPERKLASAFGTNRNTLREAIRRLEQVNLVSVRHGQGVTVLDFRDVGTIDLLEPFLLYGTDPVEKVNAFADLLAARTRVLEYAMELAIERARAEDLERLSDAADAVLAIWGSADREDIAATYAEWLNALIDAARSLPARWLANPMLELNARLTERFPGMWIMDEAFPEYVRKTGAALAGRDLDAAVAAGRDYYARVDEQILSILGWVIQSGMAGWDGDRSESEAEARRRRREARMAASRARRLAAELDAARPAAAREGTAQRDTPDGALPDTSKTNESKAP